MHSIKAIYDENGFTPIQPIPIKGKYEVIITFVNPMSENDNVSEQPIKRPLSDLQGILKGKVWMSDDFNDPIEDMKEYME